MILSYNWKRDEKITYTTRKEYPAANKKEVKTRREIEDRIEQKRLKKELDFGY